MVDATRVVHAAVVLLAMGAYSVVLFRGLNSHLSSHMYSKIETEMDKNPHMKKDYEEYKVQLEEQKRQSEQMKMLEEQAKKIQEQMEELAKKKHQQQQSPLRYVQVEGLNEIGIEGQPLMQPPNESTKQKQRIEL